MNLTISEFYNELKGFKHQEINIYFMEVQKMIKGILKNVEGDFEKENFINISIKEFKNDEKVLKNYSCKSGDKNEGKNNNKDRLILELQDLDQLKSLTKEEKPIQILYRLNIDEENIGIIIKK